MDRKMFENLPKERGWLSNRLPVGFVVLGRCLSLFAKIRQDRANAF